VVSPAKQIYHCFGCGASGDAIKFIMEIEKLTYPEAIEKLASMYNFKLEYSKTNSFLQIDQLEKVNSFYTSNLFKNKTAYNYLKQRGINDSTIEKFSLGYAPDIQTQLQFFKNANLNFKELQELGVLAGKDYPRLIERITFPIFSQTNKIIAMGGRTITNHPAKYINFTNTKLFNKSKTFYGLNFAREHILRKKAAIIVEGYMDVIMLHQAGYEHTIATLGTALTPQHLPILKKMNAKIIISYDSDTAGINAALKASKLLYKDYFEGGVVLFPEGLDPADAVKNSLDLNQFFNNPKDFKTFIIEFTAKKYDLKNPVAKKQATDELKEYILTLPEILKEDFVLSTAQYLQISPKELFINQRASTPQSANKKIDFAEASIIKTLYENRDLLNYIAEYLTPEMFKTHSYELQAVYSEEFENPKLLDIVLREDVKIYDEATLNRQIIAFLIGYYKKKVENIKYSQLKPEQKYHLMKKINEKIRKLQKGELVESDITI
jgi:DNA primase